MAETSRSERLASSHWRDELKATLAARRELGEEMEDEVVESFLGRLESAIDEQVEARVAEHLRGRGGPRRQKATTGRIAVVLALSIPLMGIAGGLGGTVGIVAMVGLALVLIFAP